MWQNQNASCYPQQNSPSLCSVTDTRVTYLSYLSPKKEKTLRGGWDQKCLKSPVSTAYQPHMMLGWDWSISKHGQARPPMKHTLVENWGSNSELMQGMAPGQRPQTLFCIISGVKCYIVLPCQDIFNVLENGNKAIFCLLAGGFARICSSLI